MSTEQVNKYECRNCGVELSKIELDNLKEVKFELAKQLIEVTTKIKILEDSFCGIYCHANFYNDF